MCRPLELDDADRAFVLAALRDLIRDTRISALASFHTGKPLAKVEACLKSVAIATALHNRILKEKSNA